MGEDGDLDESVAPSPEAQSTACATPQPSPERGVDALLAAKAADPAEVVARLAKLVADQENQLVLPDHSPVGAAQSPLIAERRLQWADGGAALTEKKPSASFTEK